MTKPMTKGKGKEKKDWLDELHERVWLVRNPKTGKYTQTFRTTNRQLIKAVLPKLGKLREEFLDEEEAELKKEGVEEGKRMYWGEEAIYVFSYWLEERIKE